MTVDVETIAARIALIRQYLRALARLEKMPLESFLASEVEQHAAERELQVAIESCIDIGHHIIAREGMRRPKDYRDIFSILAENGVLEREHAGRLASMASFRNRLVHRYDAIDARRIYEISVHDVGDIEAFVAAVVRQFDLDAASR